MSNRNARCLVIWHEHCLPRKENTAVLRTGIYICGPIPSNTFLKDTHSCKAIVRPQDRSYIVPQLLFRRYLRHDALPVKS